MTVFQAILTKINQIRRLEKRIAGSTRDDEAATELLVGLIRVAGVTRDKPFGPEHVRDLWGTQFFGQSMRIAQLLVTFWPIAKARVRQPAHEVVFDRKLAFPRSGRTWAGEQCQR